MHSMYTITVKLQVVTWWYYSESVPSGASLRHSEMKVNYVFECWCL